MSHTGVIIPQADFQQIAAPLLIDRRGAAIAPLQSRKTSHGQELIVGPWERLRPGHELTRLPPWNDVALLAPVSDTRSTPEQLLRSVGLSSAQRVLAIVLDPGDRAKFPLRLWDHGQWQRVDEVRWIGPRLLRLPDPVDPLPIDARASRTLGALRDLGRRLRSLRVVLVGAGRGASELARQLVAVGLRQLAIIDHDVIGPENLDAMPHATPRDLGQLKGTVLARSLRRNQPALTVSALYDSVTTSAALRYLDHTRADTVFSFVDDDAARLAVSWKCQQACMVHVDVGTLIRHDRDGERTMRADVRLFEPGAGCVACAPPLPRLEEALYELSAPDGALHRGPATSWDSDRSGSLHHLNALACSLAVETWLGYVAGSIATSHWTRIRWPAGGTPQLSAAAMAGENDCPLCHPVRRSVFA